MRLTALLVTAVLMSAPLSAQQAPASSPASGAASSQDEPLHLPVSVDKIREALAQSPAEPLKGLDETPTFRIEVRERQKIEELLATMKFDSGGPPVPGGLYGYDQQRRLFPSVDNPRLQPYGAFSGAEIATLTIEALIQKYLAQRVGRAIGDSIRGVAEREAREEVQRALAAYWAAQSAVAGAR